MTQPTPLVVADTTVVSFLLNRSDEAAYYEERLRGRRVVISFQTMEEMWFGAYRRSWGSRRLAALAEHLAHYGVVMPNEALIRETAQLRARQERIGRRISIPDAWIAATALMLGCPLAAHDRDYSDIEGLSLIQLRDDAR